MKRLIVLATVVATSWLGLAVVSGPTQAKVSGPNGEIAFARFDPSIGDTVTYIVNPDGSKLTAIFPGQQTSEPEWSPDGSLLAFQMGDDNPCPPCAASTVILNPDTGSFRVLSPPDPNLSTNCSIWSPDAKHFACEVQSNDGSQDGIYTVRTSDGRGLRQVTSNAGGEDVPIDYSPDGKQIVFGRLGQGHACAAPSAALYVVNVDGTGLHRITPGGFCDDDGSWSPDGTRIVFEHFGSLYTVHPDGSHLMKLALKTGSATTAFTAFDPGWSPDGTKLVFSLNTKTSAGSTQEGIGTANADGSDVQMITTSPTRDHQADWGAHPLAT